MQITRSVITNGFPRIFSVAIVLLLIGGLHPIQTFADTTTNSDTTNSSLDSNQPSGGTTNSPQQDNSTNLPDSISGSNSTVNNNLSLANQTNSISSSGDATVSNNVVAGNATTGSAQTEVNSLNIVASTTNLSKGYSATLFYDVTGNDQTNLVIDPTASNQLPGNVIQNPEIINLSSLDSGQVNNNINIISTSGNASVNNNGTAGNATSGDADASANVINLINDEEMAQQTFLGVVNIYGNLTGNIILPSQLLNNLSSSNPTNTSVPSEPVLTNTANIQSISNTVDASANSGNASVINNNVGGNAVSGKAETSVKTMDLVNNDITGNNVMIVFVNVLGAWVGEFMNAPTGTTSGVVGGNLKPDTLTQPISDVSSTTNSTNNSQINNSINVTSQSGSANVSDNGNGGNATSGNAYTGVNILNIINSNYAVSNWFGVLFINVFGSWEGSLSVATPTTNTTTPTTTTPIVSVTSPPSIIKETLNSVVFKQLDSQVPTSNKSNKVGHVLGSSIVNRNSHKSHNKTQNTRSDSIIWKITLGSLLSLAFLLLATKIKKTVRTTNTNES